VNLIAGSQSACSIPVASPMHLNEQRLHDPSMADWYLFETPTTKSTVPAILKPIKYKRPELEVCVLMKRAFS
jgi:hypothetical protein